MKKYFILYCVLFGYNLHLGQSILVKIKNNSYKNATLYYLEGEKKIFIDSMDVKQNDKIWHSLHDYSPGFYRISLSVNKHIDFIYDAEEIEIEADSDNLLDSLKITKSEYNKVYYSFIKFNKEYKTKSNLLQLILNRYPADDDYFHFTKAKIEQIQKDYLYFINISSQLKQNSLIARYVKSSQLPVISCELPTEKHLGFLQSHSLDNIDFDDAELIKSNVFANKTIEYLTYYRNTQLTKEQLEKEFMKAVDTLLNKAKVNQLVYQHIVEYLIDGFKKFGFDKIIDYIVRNYVIEDNLCLDEKTENSIQRRIDQSKLLSIGARAPNIIMPDINGKVIALEKIETKKVLVVFYISWCPHCQVLLPQLKDLLENSNGIEILAISLDNNKEDWLRFIKDNSHGLVNLNDPNGWDSEAASDYFIYATPTMFLLDSEKIIIGKPSYIGEIKNLL